MHMLPYGMTKNEIAEWAHAAQLDILINCSLRWNNWSACIAHRQKTPA